MECLEEPLLGNEDRKPCASSVIYSIGQYFPFSYHKETTNGNQ